MAKKLISILTPCYNEEDNVEELTGASAPSWQPPALPVRAHLR